MINRTKKIIYVSGKYSNGGTENNTRKKNIELATQFSIALWNLGAAVICPHTNTAFFETNKRFKKTFHTFLEGDLAMLNYVDAMYLLPNWKKSAGALVELKYVNSINIPILNTLKEAEKFLRSRVKCPCCGLTKTNYRRVNTKKYCFNCADSIQKAIKERLSKDSERFLLVPR